MRLPRLQLRTWLSSPSKRRWLTISIRGMMGLVVVTAVGLGWVVQRARAQREAVAEIRRLHGIFTYDWRISNGRIAELDATGPEVAPAVHRR